MHAAAFLSAAESLPFGTITDLTGRRGLVVVAPHPDDESLGCGGLLATASALRLAVRVVIVSDGIGSHPTSPSYPPERLRQLREEETLAATAALGVDPEHVRFLRLPDRSVPGAGPVAGAAAQDIASTVRECDAGAIFVTWKHDPHCDHAAAAAIVAMAGSQLHGIRIHSYPIWGWNLPPDWDVGDPPLGMRLDISAHLLAKARAIAAHRSQTTTLIADDPDGFRLDAATLERFAQPFEIYLEQPA